MLDTILDKYKDDFGQIAKEEMEYTVEKFYTKLWSFICDQKTVMLQPIHLNIKEKQLFYSKSDKKHLFLGPTWQMYLISDKKDENGCVMVYSPYLFSQGQVFLVPKS